MQARNRTMTALWTVLAAAIVGAPTAPAQPPSFPDLSTFAEIAQDSSIFATNRTGGHDATFSTPDGLHCTAAVQSQSCESAKVGEMPGFPSNARHLDLSPCGPASESVNSDDSGSEFVYRRNCDGGGRSPVLQPGQKVTVIDIVTCKMGDYHIPNCTPGVHGTATCAVGTDRLTACTNGTHGFVLQPSGSWTF